MARLPVVGGDDNNWGTILNDYLSVEHGADGVHKQANHMPLFGNDYSPAGDGVTDDTVKLQQAITENRQLFIPAGTYKVTAAITVPSDTVIVGTSGSILLQTNLPEDPQGAGTYGLFVLAAGTDNVEITGLTFKGEHTGPFANLSDILTDGFASGIEIQGTTCDNIRVHHNQFLNLQGSAIKADDGGTSVSFTDNYSYQVGDGVVINADNSIISNNILTETEGIASVAHYGIITDNICWRCHGVHVIAAGGYTEASPSTPPLKLGTVIANNVIGEHDLGGIILQESMASAVISDNTITYGGGNGIEIGTPSASHIIQNLLISGNLILGCTTGAKAGTAIYAPYDVDTTGVRIINNRALDGTDATYFNTNGLDLGLPDAIVRGNEFEGTTKDVVIQATATTLQMIDNIHGTGASNFEVKSGATFAPLWNRLTNEDGTQSIAAVVPVSKTATFTADTATDTYFCDATSGAITANLPTAVGINGSEYTIKKVDSGGNGVTLDPNGGETIDGAATKELQSQYATMTVVSDGANWIITTQLGTIA